MGLKARYVLEGVGIIGGMSALSFGAYLSYDAPITGTWIALGGAAGAFASAVSRSWRIDAQEARSLDDGLEAVVVAADEPARER